MIVAMALACSGDDSTDSTDAVTDTVTDGTAGTGDTAPTSPTDGTTADTATTSPTPGWTIHPLFAGTHPTDILMNGAVAVVDDEIWLTWELGEGLDQHQQWVQPVRAGVVEPAFTVGGNLTYGSFVAAIATDPTSDQVVIQKLVNCAVGPWTACADPPVEVEVVYVDRASLAVRVDPVLTTDIDGIEKGRGSLDLDKNSVALCFKGKLDNELADEVFCTATDSPGVFERPENVSAQTVGTDDHPVIVVRHTDGLRYIAYTTARYGIRGAYLSTGGAGFLLHPTDSRGEDNGLAEGEDGSLHAVWVETLVSGAMQVSYATCATPDCATADRWTSEVVDDGGKPVAATIAVHGTTPVVNYGLDGKVILAIRCPTGWTTEEVSPTGLPQYTKHGQPTVAVTDDGRVIVVYGENDASGVPSLYWAERAGPLCE
ncbi:MAG: hypothetical protein ABMB14_09800 [Myxococcota bacterium]